MAAVHSRETQISLDYASYFLKNVTCALPTQKARHAFSGKPHPHSMPLSVFCKMTCSTKPDIYIEDLPIYF